MLSCLILVAGIIILIYGRYPWGSTREVRGTPARLVGFLMLVTPLGFIAYGAYLGFEAARQGKEDPTKDDDFMRLIFIEIAVELGMVLVCTLISFSSAQPRKRRRSRFDDDDYDDRSPRRRYDEPRGRDRDEDYHERPRYRDRDEGYDDRPRRRDDYDDYDDRDRDRRRRDDD